MSKRTLIINGDVVLGEGRVLEDAVVNGRVYVNGPSAGIKNCVNAPQEGTCWYSVTAPSYVGLPDLVKVLRKLSAQGRLRKLT